MKTHMYPVLKRNYNLRLTKGRKIYKDFRTGDCMPLENTEFALLQLCNGAYTTQELGQAFQHAFELGEEMFEALLQKHSNLLLLKEAPGCAPQLNLVNAMLEAREKKWPYHILREETPFQLEVSLTEFCNHQCTYCYQGQEHPVVYGLTPETWQQVITQAARLGVQEMVFTGGEPTLYPNFYSLISHAINEGIYPKISTNGSTLTPSAIDKLHRMGVEYIHLSLPAITPDLYGEITKTNGSFVKVRRAIPYLKKKGFYLRTKMVLTAENVGEVELMIRYCGENGVDCLHLAPFIVSTRNARTQALIPPEAELARAKEVAERLESSYPDMVIAKPALNLWNWRNEKEIVRCGGIKESLTILYNGNITFCESLGQVKEFILGNVCTHSLAQVWNSPAPDRYTDVRAAKEPCKSCEYLPRCGTGCFLFSQVSAGDAFTTDPRCFRYGGPRISAADESGG